MRIWKLILGGHFKEVYHIKDDSKYANPKKNLKK